MQPAPTQHFLQSRPVFYRRLALAGIVALALIQAAWWARSVPEPLWISGSRMLCLGFLIIFYTATWLSPAVARRGDLGIYGALLLLTGHLSLTLYVSNIDLIHGFAALTVNTIAALVMFRVWQIMTVRPWMWGFTIWRMPRGDCLAPYYQASYFNTLRTMACSLA